MNFLEIHNVTKQYRNHLALSDVSFNVKKQTIYGLLGPNGAGKTSLIRILNQITFPDSGFIEIENQRLSPKHIETIGYLPEERGLYKKMKVGEQLLYLAQLKGLKKQIALEKLKIWFEKFEITSWWNKPLEELSKGMQQKIQFISTVLHEPKLIILDEPFSGFDPVNVSVIKNEILSLREQGATIIFSTHRMESVEEICDEITLINKSKKVIEGKVSEIKQLYKENIFEIEVEETSIPKSELFVVLKESKHNHLLKIEIQPKQETNGNELISFLIKNGITIHSFKEKLPDLNNIFIRLVNG